MSKRVLNFEKYCQINDNVKIGLESMMVQMN